MAKGVKTGGRDFKPGHDQPGPGRPPYPKEVREASKLTRILFEGTLNKLINMNISELESYTQDSSVPAIEVILASILQRAIRDGDHTRLDFILNRLIGKVKEKIDVDLPKPFIIQDLSGNRTILGMEQSKGD